MLSLEVKLALLVVLIAGLFGSGYVLGDRHEAGVAQARADALQVAQDKAVADAQSRVIAAQNAQRIASQNAEKDFAALKTNADDLATQLTDSLRRYTALRDRRPVPPKPGTPAQPLSTSPVAPGDSPLEELFGLAGQACLEDAAEMTALQTWVKAQGKP